MTKTTGDVFLPEIWSNGVLTAVEVNLVMAERVTRYDDMVKGKGDVLHIPNVSNLSANDKTASTQVTLNTVTETDSDLNIDKHKEVSFLVEDVLEVQSAYDLLSKYTDRAGYAIAKQIDTDIVGVATFSQSKGTGNTAFTDAVILQSIQLIDEAEAPRSDRHFVIAAKGKRDILTLAKYADSTGAGWNPSNSPILNGSFTELYGVEVAVSNNVTGATGATTTNLLFHKEALAAALQQAPRTQEQYKLEYIASLVTVDAIYGVMKLRDTFGCKVLN